MKICRNCLIEYNDKFVFCKKCGRRLDIKQERKNCPKCGQLIETNGVFCPHCGTSLTSTFSCNNNNNNSKLTSFIPSADNFVIFLGALVVLVALIVYFK